MSAPLHIAPATPTIRYVVIEQDGGYFIARSRRKADGHWWIDLSASRAFAPFLGTAITAANDAAKREREETAA